MHIRTNFSQFRLTFSNVINLTGKILADVKSKTNKKKRQLTNADNKRCTIDKGK